MAIDDNVQEAYRLYATKKNPGYSTFIDEQTITAGYGKLNVSGDWEFPLIIDQDSLKIVPYDEVLYGK